MALTQQQRDANTKANREKTGDEELRHRVRPGTKACLERNKSRAGITETSELLQVVLLNMEGLDDQAFAALTTPPRHTFEISENVARDLYQQGARRAAKLDADDLP